MERSRQQVNTQPAELVADREPTVRSNPDASERGMAIISTSGSADYVGCAGQGQDE